MYNFVLSCTPIMDLFNDFKIIIFLVPIFPMPSLDSCQSHILQNSVRWKLLSHTLRLNGKIRGLVQLGSIHYIFRWTQISSSFIQISIIRLRCCMYTLGLVFIEPGNPYKKLQQTPNFNETAAMATPMIAGISARFFNLDRHMNDLGSNVPEQ